MASANAAALSEADAQFVEDVKELLTAAVPKRESVACVWG